ncbi:hypothetical protein HT136_10480 [Novosphingobium profundi]|uniref:hypothetical protein n=1 Tax=Novosphingobium profundi TaxID=1774954 RepID=UPI001BDAE08D|nr:hypothetical protein [Novosphingobium profundi]MBT0668791.1 hypothetical protein [Novosphingobium profundi]
MNAFILEDPVERTEVVLIDGDIHRRAQIAHSLTNMASYVIPLEHYSELTQCWPRRAVLLVEDAGGSVDSLCRLLKLHAKDLPFVAFSSDASPMRRSSALLKGAGAYLPWPCSAQELKSTLLAVAASHAARQSETPAQAATASGFPQLAEPPVPAGLKSMDTLWRATPTPGARPKAPSYAE